MILVMMVPRPLLRVYSIAAACRHRIFVRIVLVLMVPRPLLRVCRIATSVFYEDEQLTFFHVSEN